MIARISPERIVAGGHQPAPWEQSGSEQPAQHYQQPAYTPAQQPAPRRGLTTRYIIGGVVAFVLFVVGPGIMAILRAVGTEQREQQQKQAESLAEDQKQEAVALCDRARDYMREQYARTQNGEAVIKDMSAQCKSGYYSSDHFRLVSVTSMGHDTSRIRGLMNVKIDCAANSEAANPYAHCTYAFNWETGSTQTNWN